jgi:hypothetical protein
VGYLDDLQRCAGAKESNADISDRFFPSTIISAPPAIPRTYEMNSCWFIFPLLNEPFAEWLFCSNEKRNSTYLKHPTYIF